MNFNSDFWLDRPVFITGASGLVGSCLTKKLLDLKADIICLERDWVPQSEFYEVKDKVKIVHGDITDQKLLERALAEYEINTVFHLAAQTIVGTGNIYPTGTFESNIKGAWCTLEACRQIPTVKQIVVASSDKAYGDQPVLPYTEETPLQGTHPYDVSKSCTDLIAQSYAHTFNLPVTISRCGNFYGGGDLNWNRLIPGTIRSIIRNTEPVIRSDGTYSRDYFHVEDGAAAYILLAEKLAQKPELIGQAFNFSNEDRRSALEMVNLILEMMESKLKPKILNQAGNEIKHQHLDATKAKKILGWNYTLSLEEGLKKTIAWYQNYFKNA